MNLLHIFKVNKRAEESGISFADVQDAVSNYDPELHEAPIVIGHPKLDDPAYGWVNSLSLAGKTVLAEPKQIVQEFAEWIDKGLYKKISASFYGKTNPENPTPGKVYLKHVGYLGAVPPKIKGLPDSSFADSGGEVLTLDFSELEFGDYRYESDNVYERLNRLEANVFKDQAITNYGESMPQTEQELEQREQAIALRERATILKEQELQFSEALDGVIKEGRVLAAEKSAHLKRLKMLAAIPADSVMDFAEGKADYSPTAEYIAELKNRPVVVNFSEISGGTPPENTTDPNKIAAGIKAEIKTAKENGETLSFAEAQSRYQAKNGGTN
jgi:hypothetical protein